MSWEARGEIIRQFILEHAEEFPKDLTKKTQEHFGISRQAVNLHVRKLVESGLLTVTGSTRARRYALRVVTDESFALPLSLSLQESYVWDVWVKPQLGTLPDNVVNIWHHGVTEMVNNAIDHSGGDKLVIRIIRTAVTSSMMINDNGHKVSSTKSSVSLASTIRDTPYWNSLKGSSLPIQPTTRGKAFSSPHVLLTSLRFFPGGYISRTRPNMMPIGSLMAAPMTAERWSS